MTSEAQSNMDIENQSSGGLQEPKDDVLLQKAQSEEPNSIFLCIVKNWSTVWFTISMDTGVLSTILRSFPYPSHWTRVCSTILFVLNLVLFLTFATIYVLHWILYYRSTSKFVRSDAEEIALQACPPIAWILLASDVQLICAQSWGYGFTILAYVMWWIAMIWILTICVTLYLHLVKYPSGPVVDSSLPTAVFIPIVGVFSAANLASVLVTGAVNDTHLGDRLAVPNIIIGFCTVGFGLGLAIVMYAIYMHRLMTSGWPAPLKIPSMILTIGPCGQSATALLGLGSAAVKNNNFQQYAKGFFLTGDAASIVRVVCVMLALFLVGFAVFWMCVDYYAIVEGLIRHKIHPSLFWWSSIFPVGTLVTALTSIGNDLDSPAFKVFAVIIFVFLFCIYIFNACFTIPMTLSGELLGLPKRDLRLMRNIGHEHTWAKYPRTSRMS